jgi:hypothetical protein
MIVHVAFISQTDPSLLVALADPAQLLAKEARRG